jgi:hypothetical protein
VIKNIAFFLLFSKIRKQYYFYVPKVFLFTQILLDPFSSYNFAFWNLRYKFFFSVIIVCNCLFNTFTTTRLLGARASLPILRTSHNLMKSDPLKEMHLCVYVQSILNYGLCKRGSVFPFTAGLREFSLLKNVQTLSGAQPSRHRVFLLFLGPRVNAGMVPVFPFQAATTCFPCSPPQLNLE